jgi:hypothetical protein
MVFLLSQLNYSIIEPIINGDRNKNIETGKE